MPQVSIVYSEDEQKEGDAIGRARGFRDCPKCSHSLHWKGVHEVVYSTGEFELKQVVRNVARSSRKIVAARGINLTCADCWAGMSIDERVAVVQKHFGLRQEAIRLPVTTRSADGVEKVDEKDAQRYRTQTAALTEEQTLILAAVREGK
jgi:hypothetical protein